MKRLAIIFVLIYLNVPGRDLILPDNAYGIENDLGVRSPYELLWTTTVSYCNVYRLMYDIFIGCGIPIEKEMVFSDDIIATYLIPNHLFDPAKTVYVTLLEFLRFRDASEKIEGFVFKAMQLQQIKNTDAVELGLVLWKSINKAMSYFMNDVSILCAQVNNWIIKLDDNTHNSKTDPAIMLFLYVNIFDKLAAAVSNNTIAYQNALDYLVSYNPKFETNNNERIVYYEKAEYENHLIPREFTLTQLVKVYELYIEAIVSFYKTKSTESDWTRSDFITWYDLNSSKSIFDYMSSKLLEHIITLTEYMLEVYKYNKSNIPKLTVVVQEYVFINLYEIIDLIKTPLQKIIVLKDEEIMKKYSNSNHNEFNPVSIGLFSSAASEDDDRVKDFQQNWIDTNIKIVTHDIVDKYSETFTDTAIHHNTNLMYWVELMAIDEHNGNVLESSLYAIILIKNLANVVGCSFKDADGLTNTDETIKNFLKDTEKKLTALYKYTMYPITLHGSNIIPSIWKNIVYDKNNIFNILNWLNQKPSSTNTPYWPNAKKSNYVYMINLIQLAHVSSNMLYDVTLTCINRALGTNEIMNKAEKNTVYYMVNDFEYSKRTYTDVNNRIMNYTVANVMYINSKFPKYSDIRQKALLELSKSIKYKIFVNTHLIVRPFRTAEYYNVQKPPEIQDYSEHLNTVHAVFLTYFGNTIAYKTPDNDTTYELINTYEYNIKHVFNRLIEMKKEKNTARDPYGEIITHNLRSVKRMYANIVKSLKKVVNVNIHINYDNYQDVKQKLQNSIALIVEDFIRFHQYYSINSEINTQLYDTKYLYSKSPIDIEKKNKDLDYKTISQIMKPELEETIYSTDPSLPSVESDYETNSPTTTLNDSQKVSMSSEENKSNMFGKNDENQLKIGPEIKMKTKALPLDDQQTTNSDEPYKKMANNNTDKLKVKLNTLYPNNELDKIEYKKNTYNDKLLKDEQSIGDDKPTEAKTNSPNQLIEDSSPIQNIVSELSNTMMAEILPDNGIEPQLLSYNKEQKDKDYNGYQNPLNETPIFNEQEEHSEIPNRREQLTLQKEMFKLKTQEPTQTKNPVIKNEDYDEYKISNGNDDDDKKIKYIQNRKNQLKQLTTSNDDFTEPNDELEQYNKSIEEMPLLYDTDKNLISNNEERMVENHDHYVIETSPTSQSTQTTEKKNKDMNRPETNINKNVNSFTYQQPKNEIDVQKTTNYEIVNNTELDLIMNELDKSEEIYDNLSPGGNIELVQSETQTTISTFKKAKEQESSEEKENTMDLTDAIQKEVEDLDFLQYTPNVAVPTSQLENDDNTVKNENVLEYTENDDFNGSQFSVVESEVEVQQTSKIELESNLGSKPILKEPKESNESNELNTSQEETSMVTPKSLNFDGNNINTNTLDLNVENGNESEKDKKNQPDVENKLHQTTEPNIISNLTSSSETLIQPSYNSVPNVNANKNLDDYQYPIEKSYNENKFPNDEKIDNLSPGGNIELVQSETQTTISTFKKAKEQESSEEKENTMYLTDAIQNEVEGLDFLQYTPNFAVPSSPSDKTETSVVNENVLEYTENDDFNGSQFSVVESEVEVQQSSKIELESNLDPKPIFNKHDESNESSKINSSPVSPSMVSPETMNLDNNYLIPNTLELYVENGHGSSIIFNTHLIEHDNNHAVGDPKVVDNGNYINSNPLFEETGNLFPGDNIDIVHSDFKTSHNSFASKTDHDSGDVSNLLGTSNFSDAASPLLNLNIYDYSSSKNFNNDASYTEFSTDAKVISKPLEFYDESSYVAKTITDKVVEPYLEPNGNQLNLNNYPFTEAGGHQTFVENTELSQSVN